MGIFSCRIISGRMVSGRMVSGCLPVMLFLCLLPVLLTPPAASADDRSQARTIAQVTIDESFSAMWRGHEFDPALKQKQQVLRDMLEKGVVSRSDLESMVSRTALSLMDREKTTRYIIKTMPERINELLSPHMSWEEARKLLWLAGASNMKEGQQAVISVGTLAPSGTPWLAVPEKLVAELERLTDNKFTIKIFAGGVMGEDTDILRKMDVGQLDGCGCTAIGILAASPETSVFLLPGLFKNYEEVDYIFEKFRKRIDSAFEERGYILSSLIDSGYFYIFSKNRINSLADIRKRKMLTAFGVVEKTLFDELGISAMPVSVTEVISSLSTGMADTNVAPPAWMLGMQAYQYAKYFIKEPILYSPGAAVVSVRTRERLRRQFDMSETFAFNVQEMLIFEFSSLEGEWKKLGRRYEERCLEAFVTKVGMEAVTLPPADREAIEQAGRRVWEKLADHAYPRDLLDEIVAALEEYRERL